MNSSLTGSLQFTDALNTLLQSLVGFKGFYIPLEETEIYNALTSLKSAFVVRTSALSYFLSGEYF